MIDKCLNCKIEERGFGSNFCSEKCKREYFNQESKEKLGSNV